MHVTNPKSPTDSVARGMQRKFLIRKLCDLDLKHLQKEKNSNWSQLKVFYPYLSPSFFLDPQ